MIDGTGSATVRFTTYGSSVIYGRSDSMINRFGIRIEVRDSLVIDRRKPAWRAHWERL